MWESLDPGPGVEDHLDEAVDEHVDPDDAEYDHGEPPVVRDRQLEELCEEVERFKVAYNRILSSYWNTFVSSI